MQVKNIEKHHQRYLAETQPKERALAVQTGRARLRAGFYKLLPVIAWIEAEPTLPSLRIAGLLLSGDKSKTGSLEWALPLPYVGLASPPPTTKMELAERMSSKFQLVEEVGPKTFEPKAVHTAARLLASLGWDGRVWPIDRGWPDGTSEEPWVQTMLHTTRKFAACVFPPTAHGARVIDVWVQRQTSLFELCPWVLSEDAVEPTDELIKKLTALASDPSLFNLD